MNVYPLVFEPIYQRRIWGGRELEAKLNKRLPPDEPIGESWEVADLPEAESRVANGPAQGRTLSELVAQWGTDLVGRAALSDGRFPLLIKFLDARQTLSVQVHPSAAVAAQRGGEVRTKDEAWYIVDAEKDAFIYRGVRKGVDAARLRAALRAGNIDAVLNRIPARPGYAFYLPSGTVHALGGGILVAEVQTPSDTTYRLYDWDRVDPASGRRRELHLEDALASASYEPVPSVHEKPEHVASVWTTVTRVIRSDSFVIERVRMVEGVDQPIPYAEMVIWVVLEGRARVFCDALKEPVSFGAGDTVLLPAGLSSGRVVTDSATVWLEVTVPIESSLAGYERPPRSELSPQPGPGLVELRLPGEHKPPAG